MDMKRLKKLMKRIFCLPPLLTLLIAIPSYALVIYALAGTDVHPVAAYSSYLLSSYAFIITITGMSGIVRWIRQGIGGHPFVRKIQGVPLFRKYLEEASFRTETSLYTGFSINLLYAGTKFFSGILYSSVWFVTLAVYYILLAVMRFSLLYYVRKTGLGGKGRKSEWRRYRLCGIILLFMNAALSGMVILAVYENNGFIYPGLLIYIMAMYAFYAIITAVMNVIKFRKYGSPVLSAAKVVNLTAALVSMLSLETAMLTQFGAADDETFRRIMTASTGAGVCVIVLGMAFYMIVRSTREVKKCGMESENAA